MRNYFSRIFHLLNQSLNILFRRIDAETDACGSGEGEGSVEGCRAVLAGTNADIPFPEEFCEIVRMDAIERERHKG